jgi:WD40 repeat protein
VATLAGWPAGNVIVALDENLTGGTLWDGATGKARKRLPHLESLRPDPTGRRVAVLSSQQNEVLDAVSLRVEATRRLPAGTGRDTEASLAWSPDGARFAIFLFRQSAAGREVAVEVSVVGSPGAPLRFAAKGATEELAWSADGAVLLDRGGHAWDPETGRTLDARGHPAQPGRSVRSPSPDGAWIAEARNDPAAGWASVVIRDAGGRSPPRFCDGTPAPIWSMELGRGGRLAAMLDERTSPPPSATVGAQSAAGDTGVRLVRWSDGHLLASGVTGTNGVTLSFDLQGARLLTSAHMQPDIRPMLWDDGAPAGRPLLPLGASLWSEAWSPDGSLLWLAVGQELLSYDARTGELRHVERRPAEIYRIWASPRGDTLASTNGDGVLRVEDTITHKELQSGSSPCAPPGWCHPWTRSLISLPRATAPGTALSSAPTARMWRPSPPCATWRSCGALIRASCAAGSLSADFQG